MTAGPMPRRVALFASCAADLAMAPAATGAKRLLEALGVEVDVPAGQSCCGQVALNSGHREPAATLARHWLDTFAGYEAVVSPSGSCVSTVHHGYPRLAAEESVGSSRMAERVAATAPRTYELTQFLATWGADLALELPARVGWHDSCHMLRMLGEKQSPRTVLGRVRGLTLHELENAESCCGFGGTFATKFPELSCAMGDAKLGAAAAADLDYLVSADPGCLLHLGGRSRAGGPEVPVIHVAELLSRALDHARGQDGHGETLVERSTA
ncbi:(Fe-S)-binding protein [Ornithinicoccus halotolerans]|uniref:(Fe-S)-binding protein n=1 Tax=Ornithinicoccus halotolerans TaxID=1748220 RepID=UPI001295B4AD|nr:(Fe-S)-binding protein [Ornithinicoccus halotolerans]